MGIDWTGSAVPWILLVVFTAAPVAAYLLHRPSVAIGFLFVAGSFSAVTVPIGGSNLRLETIAVPCLAILVIWRDRRAIVSRLRSLWLPLALVLVYVAANGLSSVLFAPLPAESMKIVVWLAISVSAAVVVALIAWRSESAVVLGPWVVAGAVIQTAVAAAAVSSQAIWETGWGVMSRDTLLGKASGLSWEANILSITLAIALPFLVFDDHRWPPSRVVRYLLLVILGIGLGLAYSRGGIIAFGVASMLAASLYMVSGPRRIQERWRGTLRAIAYAALPLVIAMGTMQMLTVGGELLASARHTVIVPNDPTSTPPPPPPPPTAPEAPADVEEYRYVGTGDTIALRWRHITTALSEVRKSPVIGLGTDSYPQRFVEPSCSCPAFINNLTAATLYESGVLGAVGLAGFATWILVTAWRHRSWAYLASIGAMLIGYQFTDAIRFGSNWVLMGVVLALASFPVPSSGQVNPSGDDASGEHSRRGASPRGGR